jgi:hypothetical protein
LLAKMQVRNLRETSGPAGAISVQWMAPLHGALAGIGLEYTVQVSDNEGVTYYESARLPFGATSAILSLIPSYPSPRPLLSGSTYVVRVAARNGNSAGLGPYASLRAFIVQAPERVGDLRVVSLSSTSAQLAWHSPAVVYGKLAAPGPSVFVTRYDLHASLQTARVMRATVVAALTAAGQDVSVSSLPKQTCSHP